MEINQKTQIDIINDLGINKSAISTWCNGTRLPRMDKVDMLAKYLHCKRSDLLEDKTEEKKEETEQSYYINEDAKELAQFLFENPDYKVLFDATKNVKKEDLETVKTIIDKFSK